jgi:hypothetical protein
MSIRGIARECDTDPHVVLTHLNVFRLPEKYQEMVWNGSPSITHIQELEPMFSKLDEGVVATIEIIALLDHVVIQKLRLADYGVIGLCDECVGKKSPRP